jgi:hypothetical protein
MPTGLRAHPPPGPPPLRRRRAPLILSYDDGSEERAPDVTVRLPHGKRSVDDFVAFLTAGRLQDCVARYDEFTDSLMLQGTDDAEAVRVVQPGTTCGHLLGMRVGHLVGRLPHPADCRARLRPHAHEMRLRAHQFVHTKQRPAHAPSCGHPRQNSVQRATQRDRPLLDAFVSVNNRYLNYMSLRLTDDDGGGTLELNGGRLTATLKLSFDMSNDHDELVPAGGVAHAVERASGGAGGPQSNRIVVLGASGAGGGGGGGEQLAER